MAVVPSALRATTSKVNAVPEILVSRRPVRASAPVWTQLKSDTQADTGNAQDVELPKRQVAGPASVGVAEVLKFVVPVAGKVIGVTLTMLLPAGMVNAPKLGKDAGLPVWVKVPVATPNV